MVNPNDRPVDQWYTRDLAHGISVAGKRGEMRVIAVDRDEITDTTVPIAISPNELDDWDEVDRDDVPDWAIEYIEEQYRASDENFDAVREASSSDD